MEAADAKQEAEAPLRTAVGVKDVEEEKAPIPSPAERKLDDSDAVAIDESEKPLSALCLCLLSPYVCCSSFTVNVVYGGNKIWWSRQKLIFAEIPGSYTGLLSYSSVKYKMN